MDPMNAGSFDWQGVNIGIQTNHERRKDGSHFLFLRFIVDNEKGKQAPYVIDVRVMGRFDYVGPDPEDKATDLVVVNGLSILYGAIREMCTIVTARMPYGAICLPGANFMDHRPSLKPDVGPVGGRPSRPEVAAKPRARPKKRPRQEAS
jgi:preprotein translocase subunit SecB